MADDDLRGSNWREVPAAHRRQRRAALLRVGSARRGLRLLSLPKETDGGAGRPGDGHGELGAEKLLSSDTYFEKSLSQLCFLKKKQSPILKNYHPVVNTSASDFFSKALS